MHIKQTLARAGVLATATAFISVVAVAPGHATLVRSDSAASTQGAQQSQANQAERAESRGNGPRESRGTAGKPATPARSARGVRAERRQAEPAERHANGNATDKRANGSGHTPVTVCHLLGNGGYIELTFDENALEAHLAHGDLHPVPAAGCPAADEAVRGEGAGDDRANGHTPVTVCHLLGNGTYHLLTFDEHALEAHLAHGDSYPAPATDAACPAGTAGPEVLGLQQERAGAAVQLEAPAANRAPATDAVLPAAGIVPAAGSLPATGAGDYAVVVVAGVGLLAAGGVLLARRRAGE